MSGRPPSRGDRRQADGIAPAAPATTASGAHAQGPMHRLAALAIRHPWWYAGGWALVLAGGNLLLRVVLTRMPLARAAPLAALTGVAFFLAIGLLTRWRARTLPPQHAAGSGGDHPPHRRAR